MKVTNARSLVYNRAQNEKPGRSHNGEKHVAMNIERRGYKHSGVQRQTE